MASIIKLVPACESDRDVAIRVVAESCDLHVGDLARAEGLAGAIDAVVAVTCDPFPAAGDLIAPPKWWPPPGIISSSTWPPFVEGSGGMCKIAWLGDHVGRSGPGSGEYKILCDGKKGSSRFTGSDPLLWTDFVGGIRNPVCESQGNCQ